MQEGTSYDKYFKIFDYLKKMYSLKNSNIHYFIRNIYIYIYTHWVYHTLTLSFDSIISSLISIYIFES